VDVVRKNTDLESSMNRIRLVRLCLAAGLLAPVAVPAQQQRLSADELKAYGGSYAVECARLDAPRLIVAADAISVERDGQRLVGRNVTASASYYGRSPPKNFEAAVIGAVRGGGQMMFMVYADNAGRYVLIEAEPRVQDALGPALLKARYRSCNAGGVPMAETRPAIATPATATSDAVPDIAALLANPLFKRSYLRSIGEKASERWLARLDGPAPPTRRQLLEGAPYLLVAVCKPHACYEHNAVFLYSAEPPRVLGLIHQAGVKTLVGGATPAQGAQLDLLWQAEWRQK
jgi:hypothetical protein